MRKISVVVALIFAPLAGMAYAQDTSALAADNFCIVNASHSEMFFVAETREGVRMVSMLDTGGQLCSATTGASDGIVSVFQGSEHLEGCSRIIKTGRSEEMLEYAEFDRCGWQSHSE